MSPATMHRRFLAAGLVVAGLAGAAPSRAADALPAPSTAGRGIAMQSLPGVTAVVFAPKRVDYDPQALGASGHFVGIRLTNGGPRPVPLSSLRARFAAARDGVSFPCNERSSTSVRRIEPAQLEPGQSFELQRLLDCRMPLPGRYEVRLWLGPVAPAETQPSGEYLDAFDVDVEAWDDSGPRAVPSRRGLYAILVGAETAPAITPEEWAKGAYKVAIALINGGATPVAPAPARVSLLLYKEGAPSPCSQGSEPLDVPATLTPGSTYVTHVSVRCAPTGEGRYRIEGSLSLPGTEGLLIGRVGLQVTSYLYLLRSVSREER